MSRCCLVLTPLCVSYVVCVVRRVCRTSCLSSVVCGCASCVLGVILCCVTRRLFSYVFPTFFAHLLGLRLFILVWSPFAFDLSYAPARLCTSAGVPRSTRAGRGFPLGVYISLAAWWSFSFARAVLVFLRVVHWGGPFPLSVRGGFLSCSLGGTSLLFDAHTFVRTADCLPPVYCCFVASWLFDVRVRYCGPGRVIQAPFNRRSPQLRSIAFHTAPRIL